MSPLDSSALVHLVGFATGTTLYALLGAMVIRRAGEDARPAAFLADTRLVLAAAVLGLVWNVGALLFYGWHDLGIGAIAGWVAAPAFGALGFLPAVVVHATLAGWRGWMDRAVAGAAYALSAAAALLQLTAAAGGALLPSRSALLLLTVGFVGITIGLAARQRVEGRMLPLIGLAVFAVSALHLGHHLDKGEESLFVALVGHHASLPLALVILYQDYRFALADVFLKRALALVMLVALVVAVYLQVAAPLVGAPFGSRAGTRPDDVVLLLVLWIATALAFPTLRQATDRLVDRFLLRRPDYPLLRATVTRQLESASAVDDVLDRAARALADALSATVSWRPARVPTDSHDAAGDDRRTGGLVILVPVADEPVLVFDIGAPAAGRRLLSDDLAFADNVALVAGRRVDALRVLHERCDRDMREAEMRRLASEAELSALRGQLNPHFLFNTLNTVGYLMQVAPARAQDVLRHVADILRAVLYRSQREHCTLGEEIDLVEAYLAVETARFEERLHVIIDVPEDLRRLLVPPLLLQPLVENAVKHGVARRRAGGTVTVRAEVGAPRIHASDGGAPDVVPDAAPHDPQADVRMRGEGGDARARLCVSVHDTGAGSTTASDRTAGCQGVGLSNLERRLARYYGEAAGLSFHSVPEHGMRVEVWLPVDDRGDRARALESATATLAPVLAVAGHWPALPGADAARAVR